MSKGLREVMDQIDDIDIDAELAKQDDQDGPDAVKEESPPAKDEPGQDPDKDSEAEEAQDEPAKEGAADDAEAEPEAVETKDEEKDEEAEPTYNIDGKEVPLSEVLEWRDGRQELKARLTTVSQEASQRKKEYEQAVQAANEGTKAQRKLVTDLTADATVSKFLKKHPDALPLLLEEPDEARKLISNPQVTTAFWEDYEALKANPRLAQRLTQQPEGSEGKEEVSQEVLRERNLNLSGQVWKVVEETAVAIALERGVTGDEDQKAVLASLLEVVGIPTDGTATEQDVFNGTSRALNLMFKNDPQQGGIVLDRRMLDDRFDLFEARKTTPKKRADAAAEEHNADVDAALTKEPAPPKTPSGDAPTATKEKLPKIEGGLRGVMDAIDEMVI